MTHDPNVEGASDSNLGPLSPPAPAVPQQQGQADSAIDILIVDDEPANLVVLETILDDPGYRLIRASSADEALLAVIRHEFALLILDVRMPGMDGIELAQMIKERKKSESVPIIFLTAYHDEEEHIADGYGSGAVDFLNKPVNASVLRSKVAVFADLCRKTRTIAMANGALLAEVQERRRVEEDLRQLNQTLEERVRERSEALRRADVQLREMMTSITDALFMVDRDWRVTYANDRAAALMKTDISRLQQSIVWDLPFDQLGSMFRERAETAIRSSTTVHFDQFFPESGKWLQCHCYPSESGLSVYFVDITDRMEVEERRDHLLAAEQAARAEVVRVGRAKDDFLASLSHELRTPLAAILGWANVLQRPQVDSATFQRGIEVIARNAKAQSQLVSDLMDVSRVESGKLRIDFHNADMNDVVAVAVDTLSPTAHDKGIRVHTRLARDGAVTVMGNEERLHQVVSNLVSNALKFSAPGGTVTVETIATPTHVELRVMDDGEGISAEFLPHLFERFSQADSSAARIHGGLGLGLAIVKNLVEVHGGTVQAFSDGLGHGSTFTVRVPVAVERRNRPRLEKPQRMQSAANEASEWGDLTGICVLLVDDHPDVLEIQRRILCEAGARVEIASNANDALARIRSGGLDAMLSDLGMPGMDGYSLMRAVRSDLALSPSQLPSAAVTAFVRAQDRERALEHGYQLVLQKPVKASDLVKTVHALANLCRSPPSRNDAETDSPTRALRALYVEDNLDLQEQIGFMLNEHGVEFTAFANAEDALAATEKACFDVVITDVSLPGMSGVEMVKLILERDPHAWVIFSTGYLMEALGKLGPNVRVLVKPFDLDQLQDVLQEVRGGIVA